MCLGQWSCRTLLTVYPYQISFMVTKSRLEMYLCLKEKSLLGASGEAIKKDILVSSLQVRIKDVFEQPPNFVIIDKACFLHNALTFRVAPDQIAYAQVYNSQVFGKLCTLCSFAYARCSCWDLSQRNWRRTLLNLYLSRRLCPHPPSSNLASPLAPWSVPMTVL